MRKQMLLIIAVAASASAFVNPNRLRQYRIPTDCQAKVCSSDKDESRRSFLTTAAFGVTLLAPACQRAEAIGPVKVDLKVKDYVAKICPPERPIPGEKGECCCLRQLWDLGSMGPHETLSFCHKPICCGPQRCKVCKGCVSP